MPVKETSVNKPLTSFRLCKQTFRIKCISCVFPAPVLLELHPENIHVFVYTHIHIHTAAWKLKWFVSFRFFWVRVLLALLAFHVPPFPSQLPSLTFECKQLLLKHGEGWAETLGSFHSVGSLDVSNVEIPCGKKDFISVSALKYKIFILLSYLLFLNLLLNNIHQILGESWSEYTEAREFISRNSFSYHI